MHIMFDGADAVHLNHLFLRKLYKYLLKADPSPFACKIDEKC